MRAMRRDPLNAIGSRTCVSSASGVDEGLAEIKFPSISEVFGQPS